jgi:hypothetical protein
MAVFHVKCANTEIRIHEIDHLPPHCHVKIDGRDVRVRLDTLQVFGSDWELTPAIRKCLRKHRSEMQEAWQHVVVTSVPPGRR